QDLCNDTMATLAANAATSGTGSWMFLGGPSLPVFANPSSENTTVTNLQTGVYTFRWTISNGVCAASTDDVQISIFSIPSAASAGTDQTLCSDSTAILSGNNPVSGTGSWSQIGGPNTAIVYFPASSTTAIAGLIPGTYSFVWTISSGPCAASLDTID